MSDHDVDTDEYSSIEIADSDAAIILRDDGTLESFLPETDDDTVAPGSPGMIAAVIMYLLSDENRYRALEREFLEMCDQAAPDKVYH